MYTDLISTLNLSDNNLDYLLRCSTLNDLYYVLDVETTKAIKTKVKERAAANKPTFGRALVSTFVEYYNYPLSIAGSVMEVTAFGLSWISGFAGLLFLITFMGYLWMHGDASR